MVNMRILIRMVFVIFIANGIDYLGGVCDDCCDCFKEKEKKEEKEKKDKEIKEDENITAESLVNTNWYNAKKENLVLKIFKKEDNVFTSTENGDKISFELDEKDNSKIIYQNETETGPKLEDPLNLKVEKYALFEIKTKGKNTAYLYCSDVESSEKEGIFANTTHISISVTAYDTKNVTNMGFMFSGCSSLTELDLQKFNTTNVTDIGFMFLNCSSLENLNLNNFNTEKVTNMMCMFLRCSKLKNLDISNFNTTKVTKMQNMFNKCSSLTELNLQNFNTTNVTNMGCMFCECSNLTDLKFGNNFNTTKVTDKTLMFYGCSSFPEDIQNKLNNVEEIIDFFKGKNK